KDMLILETQASMDTTGLLAPMNAIRQALPPLPWPIEAATQATPTATHDTATTGKQHWYDKFLASLAYIKQFLIIRRHNNTQDFILDSAGKNNVLLLIDLALSKAEIGLLRRDDALYQQSLQQTAQLISRSFNPQDAQTKTVLD